MGHQLAHRKSLTPWTVSLPFAQQIKDAFSAATDAYQNAPALVHELDKLARLATANHHQIAGSWPDSLLAAFTFLTSPGEAYAVTR